MTPKQEEALREYLQEAIMPLIEQVLVKKLGQAMLFAADQLMQPKREWVGLTDEEILSDDTLRYYYGMSGGAGPVSQQGKKVIAAIEAKLKEKNT